MKLSHYCFSVLLFAVPALAVPWTVDDTHSAARFKVRHMMISNVKGEVTGIKGTMDVDDADPSKTKVDVTLDAKSISTNNKKRDDHLRASDFFDTKKFPTMKFVSKKVEKTGEKWKVTGDLTIHGVTKETVLDGDAPSAAVKDPWGNMRRGWAATTKLSRKDFGLTWNKAIEGGGVVVSDEVDVEIEVEFVAPAAPKKS